MKEGVQRRRVLAGVATAALAGIPSRTALGHAQQQAASDGWPMFGYDPANTGHAPDRTGPTGGVTEQWRFQTDEGMYSSSAVADGTVYVGSDDGNVYAFYAGDDSKQTLVKKL